MTLPKILESTSKIRFQDCDPFNHLNNAEYLNYMINAREDQVEQHYDLNIYTMAKSQGISWVVGSHQIAYVRPAFFMEEVVIDSQLFKFTKTQLHVEIKMWNTTKTEIKALLWSTFVHFNLRQQNRYHHNPDLMELFEKIVSPINTTGFKNRVAELKPQKT